MLDEIAIQQTLNRYSEGCSRADWDQVMGTFMPDGIWEISTTGARFQGHAMIREAMAAFVSKMAYFVQLNTPATITVEGDRATARSIIRECGKFANRAEALEVFGFYSDELVRTADGWKFQRRRFEGAGAQNFTLLPNVSLS